MGRGCYCHSHSVSDNVESADVVSDVESNGERGGNRWVVDVSCSRTCRCVTRTAGRIAKVPCILDDSIIDKISVMIVNYNFTSVPYRVSVSINKRDLRIS